MRSSKGKYIVFEGIDGSGKGTQLKLLLEKLSEESIPFHETREPTAGPIGKMLRETFLTGKYETTEMVRQMLFAADRFDHFYNPEHGVLSKLGNGINVISDRSYISGIAYAGTPGWDIYHGLRHWLIVPDLVVFLDINPEVSMSRISDGRELEIYENLDNLIKVRNRYLDTMKRLENHNIKMYDASNSIEDVHKDIWRDVSNIL